MAVDLHKGLHEMADKVRRLAELVKALEVFDARAEALALAVKLTRDADVFLDDLQAAADAVKEVA